MMLATIDHVESSQGLGLPVDLQWREQLWLWMCLSGREEGLGWIPSEALQCFGLQQMVRLWWAVWLLCVEAAGWAARRTDGDGEAAHCAGGWETVQLHRSSDQWKSIVQSRS